MTIQSIVANIAAYSAQGKISTASDNASASISRLSSGDRIHKASDDVAGLAVGTALRTQVTTLRTALQNAAQGSSLLQVADGALGQIIDILQRQKAIAVQASSGQLTDANRSLLNQEFTALTAEVDRLATGTNFNGVNLLAGGLGNKPRLSTTNALSTAAAVVNPSLQTANDGVVAASTVPIQAFGTSGAAAPGASLFYNVANAGTLRLVSSTGATLPSGSYDSVDASVYGQFSDFQFNNVSYGAVGVGTATLTATLNGVQYTGNVVSNATTASAILVNGNTRIQLALGAVDFSDAGSTELARSSITNIFSTTVIVRTSTLQGVNFEGTYLDGAIGAATTGNATVRLSSNGPVDISNFEYVGSSDTANTNILRVRVNGQTFTAANVDDNAHAAGTIQFTDEGKVQGLLINLTGLGLIASSIRTNLTTRAAFIGALNQGFSRAGSGLEFTIGKTNNEAIRIQFGSAVSDSIYNGNPIDVNTATNAQNASNILDAALTKVVSLRASVGALQSRFNYATNSIQSSIENEDAARGAILDTDVSVESTAYASAQVQVQAGISVLAQANQLPQNLLKLLG